MTITKLLPATHRCVSTDLGAKIGGRFLPRGRVPRGLFSRCPLVPAYKRRRIAAERRGVVALAHGLNVRWASAIPQSCEVGGTPERVNTGVQA